MSDRADFAGQLAQRCRIALEQAQHAGCPYLSSAHWIPAGGGMSAMTVCGCGFMIADPQPAPAADYAAQDPIRATLDLIDPTETYTPDQVERHILDVLYRLETGALFERECIQAADAAAAAFNRIYWATIHTSELTSELKRKAAAEVACEEQGLTKARDESKMMKNAAGAALHNLRAVLSGYQSVAKSVTAAYNPGGSAGRF